MAQRSHVDIPFDLNKIFSLTYEFQPLKEVLEHIFGELAKNRDEIGGIEKKVTERFSVLEKLKSDNEKLFNDVDLLRKSTEKEVSGLKTAAKELEHKSIATDEQVSEARANLENCHMNLSLLEQRVRDLEAKSKQPTHSAMVVSSPDLDSLYKILSEYAKKSEFGDYTLKTDRDDILKRLNKVEKKVHEHEKWEDKWEKMEKDIDYLLDEIKKKVSKDELDLALDRLKEIISQMSGNGNAVAAVFDSSDLKEALRKLQGEVAQLQKQQSATQTDLVKLTSEHNATQKQALATAQDLSKLTIRVDRLEDLLNKLQRSINDMQIRLAQLAGQPPAPTATHTATIIQGGNSGVDESIIQDLLAKLKSLEHEFDNFRNEISKLFRDFQDSLNNKADIEALQNLERLLLDRINELLDQLTKKFADKKDTKKALKLLERQIKNLYDLIMSTKNQHQENEEDAMFTKKPLGGMSCASCEKNLINLYGKQADYLPWNRFPFRDPAERIAKVGQGFSKMLSMINPDSLTRFESHAKFSSSNIHHGSPMVHEAYYEHHGGMDAEKHAKGTKSTLNNLPKTQSNFYPGPLGSVDEHRAGLNTAGGNRLRPTSANVKKHLPKNNIVRMSKKM